MLKALITLEAGVVHPPVTELQPGRGAPKSIRRWKPSPETYPASDGVAQRLERLTVNQRVDGSNPSTIANADLAQLVERLPCKQDVSGSSPLIGTSTTGKGIFATSEIAELGRGFESLRSTLTVVMNAQADARKTLQLLRKRAVRLGN